ncbi:MAG: hypothetical protein SF339_20495 [Blastocatellia bacterium]|nr:hypothetical protein [Blastocatellia bacterium]
MMPRIIGPDRLLAEEINGDRGKAENAAACYQVEAEASTRRSIATAPHRTAALFLPLYLDKREFGAKPVIAEKKSANFSLLKEIDKTRSSL